ncbi:MAG: SprB repeat-containing protein, partial [Bacteroidota bacterium]
LLNIKSNVAGNISTISKIAGVVNVDYVALQDITAIGGAIFNANNSVDLGNVTGWNFTALASTDYYWIGGAGNWSDPLNWSLVSGGPANAGGCIPTQVDNVFFDGNSGLNFQTVTIDQIAYCNNMDWTGATNARMSGTSTLNVYGSLTYNASMLTLHTGYIYFKSDNIGNTINTAGVTVRGHVRFDGAGEWTLLNDFTSLVSSSKNIYLDKGSIITNNNNITTTYFYSTTDKTRQLTLGSSVVDVTGWRISNGTNLIIIPGTSTITVNTSGYVQGGSQSYNIFNINATSAVSIYGGNVYNNLNIPAATSIEFEGGLTQTFNNLTIPSGTDCNNYFNIGTLTPGMVANLSMPAGVFNGNWLIISDLTAGGGAAFNALSSQGIGNVTGWNIFSPAPVDLYWIGNGGNWSDPNHWSLVTGGLPYGCIPTSEDNVFFDGNSFSLPLQVVNVDIEGYCKNMDWTGVTNTPEISGWPQLNINGSLTLVSSMTLAYWGTFNFTSSLVGNTIKSAGLMISGLRFSGSGDYTLQDDLTLDWNGITFNNGILNTNNFDINCPDGNFTTSSSSLRTLNLGASTIIIQTWDVQDNTNFTLNAGTSEIITSSNTWSFTGGDLTYNDVSFINPMWGGITVYGSNTFNTLYIEPGTEIIFEDGAIQTTTDFLATGNPGNLIFIHSITPGNQAFINQTSHEFCGDWLNIQDISVGTMTFYTGENSNDLGNNFGWTWSGVEANDQYPAALCEEVPGGGTVSGVNLTLLEVAIDGGNGYIHTWYLDAALTTLVPAPTNAIVSNGQIFYDEVDNGICTNIAEIIYTVYSLPVASFVITDVTCNGGNDGAVDLTVNSGTFPFTYLWSTGAGIEDIAALIAGTYTVTITDIEGCQTIDNAVVLQPTAISIDTEAYTDIICNGDNDGTITVTASGGTGILSYDIGAGAQPTGNFTNLAGGIYTVTVTDANLCTAVSSAFTITDPAAISIDSEASTDIICNGDNDGTITVTASGGIGVLSYDIGAGVQPTGNFTNLAGGIYTVTVTDANLCAAVSSAITITDP